MTGTPVCSESGAYKTLTCSGLFHSDTGAAGSRGSEFESPVVCSVFQCRIQTEGRGITSMTTAHLHGVPPVPVVLQPADHARGALRAEKCIIARMIVVHDRR